MTATTVTQAVEKRQAGIVNVMWARKTHFAAILPDHVDVKPFLGTAAAALYASPRLMEAAESNPDSLITALMRCGALGHQPGTDEFYLTPRKIKGRLSVLGIEGYRGVIERMYRSGAVASVVVREVCERDGFSFTEGADVKPRHEVDWFGGDRGQMIGVYAYATLTTGAVSRVVILNRDDVMAARDAGGYTPGDEHSPWNRLDAGKDHPEYTGRSMWWKTGAKRLEPWVPTSAEYRREQLRAAVQAAGPAAQPPASVPVYDAELAEPLPPAETPSNGAAKQEPPASKAALGRLDDLVRQLDLGPDDHVRELWAWLTAEPWTASRSQVDQASKWLQSHLDGTGGDTAQAASNAWKQYNEANPQAGDDGA